MSTYRVPVYSYTAADLASSSNVNASRTVVISGGMDYRRQLFIYEYFIRLGSHPFDTMTEITRQARHYRSRRVGIEKNRYEDFLKMYKTILQRDGILGSREPINIVPIEHYGGDSRKEDRIVDTLHGVLKSGSLYARRSQTKLMEHIEGFPQLDFSDLMDALEMLYSIAKPPPEDLRVYKDVIGDYSATDMVYNPVTMSWEESIYN